ncbi:short chain dehydrogenase domain-containing protein [Trichoderma breve]|uniref:Short chain dehydrogenase domain-containing protein n=1 Tax=Trichoderma breve TaxID=2034170 RepID=A0A9W9BC27_9HYPO|nr:short chain dehydrogenase domain-containing protein [Trichoderma breve]KAJ4857101.1 short chain dehydrogenase domain-containing protein [Trichoderma breve]
MPDPDFPTKCMADFFSNQRKDLPIALETKDVKDKTYIVTGATGGLGYEAAKRLVQLEAAKVVIGVRNEEKGEFTKTTIEKEAGRKDVIEVWPLDLASYDSVKAFGKRLETIDRIDALVLNAGVSHAEWQVKEGSEAHMTVNFIANLLLTFEALPILQASASKHDIKPRIVVVGSMGGFFAFESIRKFPKTGVLDDLNDKAKWKPLLDNRYNVSKLFEHFAVRELASLKPVSETGIIVNLVDPGLCKTELIHEQSPFVRFKAWCAKLIMGRSPEMGSRTLIHGIAADEESHGKYLTACEIREEHIPEWVTNEAGQVLQKQIWAELLEKLEKIQPGVVTAVIHE